MTSSKHQNTTKNLNSHSLTSLIHYLPPTMSLRRFRFNSDIGINWKTQKLTVRCTPSHFLKNYVTHNPIRDDTKLMSYIRGVSWNSFEKTVDYSQIVWKLESIDDEIIVKIPDRKPHFAQWFQLWFPEECKEDKEEDTKPSVGDFKTSAQTVSHGRWILCDGSYYHPKQYPELFDVIGYEYGDGEDFKFRVPDISRIAMKVFIYG